MDNNIHSLNFGFSSKKNTFQKLSIKLENNMYILFTVLGTALFTYAGGFASSAPSILSRTKGGAWHGQESLLDILSTLATHPTLHFFYGAMFVAFGLRGTSKDYANLQNNNQILNDEVKTLQHDREQLGSSLEEISKLNVLLREKHEQLVKTWLKGTFSNLLRRENSTVQDNTYARVSIYYVYNNEFYILARYSPNGELDKIHRQKFKSGRGIINKIYQHLEWHENKLPFYDEENSDEYYTAIEKEYGYKKEQLSCFSMKTCRYFGEAIREADMTIGIILYESLLPEDLQTEQQINNIRNYHERNRSHLCQFVRYGIKHDITVKHHDNVRTDKDVLGELTNHTDLDGTNEPQPKKKSI